MRALSSSRVHRDSPSALAAVKDHDRYAAPYGRP
jgi:hypothetical protein